MITDAAPKQAAPDAPQRVLVLDGDQGSALTIVRSLGRRGISCDIASDVDRPLAGFSRYTSARLRYPGPMKQEASFIEWLVNWQTQNPNALVFPVTERTVVPIHRHRMRFDERRIAIAPKDALEQVLDKERTMSLAISLGIPVPRSSPIRSLAMLDAVAADFAFPVVVKPNRSVGQGDDGRVQLAVSYAFDALELKAQVRHALAFGDVLLQQYFPGEGVGIELIACHGEVCRTFQHRRLHEVPLTGGGSSLRISEEPTPALCEAASLLMRALSWHGVAMVEFKYQPATAAFRLMEINGRFWGSLPLAVAAGADFPAMLHRLMTAGHVGEWPAARNGVICRQLSRDIDWLEMVLRGGGLRSPATIPTRRQALRDTLLVFAPHHRFDVQSLSDPKPGLIDLWRMAQSRFARLERSLRHRIRLQRARWQATADRGRALTAASVLFVCYGNINRSALAESHARVRHAGRARFASAGFYAVGGRPADPMMIATAGSEGIDLSSWQSRTLTDEAVDDADIIFVMELQHADRVIREHPRVRGKVALLGAAAARHPGEVEIPDPYGKAPEVYAHVYRQVVTSVDAWLASGKAESDGA